MHKSKIINYTDKTNNAYISIEIITYKLLCCLWIIPMHRHPNVDEMGTLQHDDHQQKLYLRIP
jgi:hypothetical protein